MHIAFTGRKEHRTAVSLVHVPPIACEWPLTRNTQGQEELSTAAGISFHIF